MTINPKDAKPDQVFEVTLDEERFVAMRNNPRQEYSEWRLIPKPGVQALWAGDGAVKNLVPLVHARKITRADLPSADDLWAKAKADNLFTLILTPGFILDEVVVDHWFLEQKARVRQWRMM